MQASTRDLRSARLSHSSPDGARIGEAIDGHIHCRRQWFTVDAGGYDFKVDLHPGPSDGEIRSSRGREDLLVEDKYVTEAWLKLRAVPRRKLFARLQKDPSMRDLCGELEELP